MATETAYNYWEIDRKKQAWFKHEDCGALGRRNKEIVTDKRKR